MASIPIDWNRAGVLAAIGIALVSGGISLLVTLARTEDRYHASESRSETSQLILRIEHNARDIARISVDLDKVRSGIPPPEVVIKLESLDKSTQDQELRIRELESDGHGP